MKQIIFPLLMLGSLAGCANNASTTQPPTGAIYEQRANLANIWAGYDPVQRGIGYYDAETGLITLIKDVQEVLPGFTAQGPGVWLSEQPQTNLRSEFYIERPIPIADLRVTLVRNSPRRAASATTLFHEDFHGFQKRAFERSEAVSTLNQFDHGDLPIEHLVAAIRRERQLLIGALQANADAQRDELLMLYASLRLWREKQMPTASVHVEREIETWEGTANWVGYRAAYRTLARNDESLEHRFSELLEYNYEEIRGARTMRLLTARVYATGAALSELLTRRVGPEWQHQVENDAHLFSLLLAFYDWPQDRLTELGGQIIETRQFKRAVIEARDLDWPPAADQLIAQIESAHRWRLTFYLPEHNAGFAFSGADMTPLDDGGILLNPAEQLDISEVGLEVQIKQRSLIKLRQPNAQVGESTNNADELPPSMHVFLNRLPAGIECPRAERVCNGTVQTISHSGLSLQSDEPVKYRLERL